MGVKDYLANRVATANGAQLVAILYEGLMESLADAQEALTDDNSQALMQEIDKSRNILAELLATLRGNEEIANQLRGLYLYVNQLITEAVNKKEPLRLQDAQAVLRPLYEGWCQLGESLNCEGGNQGPAIVSGFTYGKGQLTDHVVNQDERWKKG
ncbi:flagellar export chaperone FliS [Alkaliphilus crotonatoxidans]